MDRCPFLVGNLKANFIKVIFILFDLAKSDYLLITFLITSFFLINFVILFGFAIINSKSDAHLH